MLLPVLYFISLIAYKELTNALGPGEAGRIGTPEAVGLLGISVYYITMYAARNAKYGAEPLYLLIVVVAVVLAELFIYVLKFPKYESVDIEASVFAFMYAPLMLSFVYLTRESTIGIYTVWLILISSWGCDTCAYVVGILIGKHKIFPVLSPKKSLEGCIGGILGAALIGGVYAYFFVNPVFEDKNTVASVAVICAVGAVMSMFGDLAASAIKRNHNIKDYGNLIPGHGGIMDRFDSMIITAPMTYFLSIILLGL